MGRRERRFYNKQHKTHYTKEEFDVLIAMSRIKSGNTDFSDLQFLPKHFAHMDNIQLAPEGCVCKLNYDELVQQSGNERAQGFLEWVEEHKDQELHLTRENAENSLVCIKEDERYTKNEETGELDRIPPWLFDVYTDLLFKDDNGEYKTLAEIEGLFDNKVVIDQTENEEENTTDQTENEEKE